MSEKFNGFSKDEIERISTAKAKGATFGATNIKQGFRGHNGIRRMPATTANNGQNGLKKQPPKTAVGKSIQNNGVGKQLPDDTFAETNLDRSMSKSIEEALFYMPTSKAALTKPTETGTSKAKPLSAADDSSILHISTNLMLPSATAAAMDDSSILPELKPTKTQLVFKGISLKDFETHRRIMEEQNKQKKQMLFKAIEHHTEKTAFEARRMEEIKKELAKLDTDFALDVAILRKQIDDACVHFANIEKEYIKIESQFLKAKMDLHNAAEKKELLTEHLCTIIGHNEDRKAQKLSELMEKVGLTPAGECHHLPMAITAESNNK